MTHRTLRYQVLRLMVAAAIVAGLFMSNVPRARPAQAANGTVGNGLEGSCTPGALQSVLNTVQGTGGGLIDFSCGPGPHTIVVAATLQITSSVSFDGGALGDITLSGGDARRVFYNQGGALSLTDMVVAHGKVLDGFGGCIFSGPGLLTLLRTTVHTCQSGPAFAAALSRPAAPGGSAASGGGAIYNSNGIVTLQNSEVLTSSAESGGGIQSFGNLSLTGSRLAGNTARDFGGGLAATGVITIVNSLVEHNKSLSTGGGILGTSSTQLLLVGSRVYSNTASFDAGGIYSQDVFASTNSEIVENTAGRDGGGIFIQAGSASLDHGVVAGNRAGEVGGGLWSNSLMVLTDTQVLSNTSAFAGGGASVAAITLLGGLFQNNRCTGIACDGGGLTSDGALVLTDTQFISNTSLYSGGGASAGSAAITGGVFQDNHCIQTGCQGGGLYTGSLALTNTVFLSNTSQLHGGGAFGVLALTVTGGLFQGNYSNSGNGGGLYVDDPLTLAGTDFTGNQAGGDGGGAYADGSITVSGGVFRNNACTGSGCYGGGLNTFFYLTLTGTQFISNSAASRGGGVHAGTVFLNGGVFRNNSCQQGGCRGGGLFAETLAMTATQFIGNASAGDGGAVQVGSGRMVNALFARNSAAANGAAIFLYGTGLTTILHNTIAGPAAFGSAAAIHVTTGTVGITNTLVASYSVGILRTAGTVTEDYNLFFNAPAPTVGGVTSGGHSFSGNPAFADPAHDDYHLRPGSAAFDKGVNAGVTHDVDGDPRPLNAGFDIGFDEFALRVLFLPLVRR